MSENVRVLQSTKPTQNVYSLNENFTQPPKKVNSFELVMSQMGIANVEAFNNAYSEQWQSAAMDKQLLSVLICEVDFYQAYVDNHGDQGASFMMVSMALLLKNICEKSQAFLSFNEHHGFSILVKSNTVQDVQDIAIELCEGVKQSKTEHKNSLVSDIVTLSVGTSSFYPTTPDIFKAEAQKALEKSKAAGGNQINDLSEAKSVTVSGLSDVTEEMLKKETAQVSEKAIEEITLSQERAATENTPRNSQPFDLFAETLDEVDTPTKMYRGQVIENEIESTIELSFKDSAVQESVEEAPVEVIKKKAKPVRMYRGQIIQD